MNVNNFFLCDSYQQTTRPAILLCTSMLLLLAIHPDMQTNLGIE